MTTQAVSPPVRWSAPDGVWTEPDLHLFPQDGHRYEIVDGCLHASPPPPEPHETIVRALVTALRAAAPPGWWVCARLGIAMDSSNLVPDVTVLRPRSSGAVWSDPADVALVVEVETAATRRYDRVLKPTLYAEAGIKAFWRVEPGRDGPVLHTYALGAARYRAENSIEGAEPVKLDAPYPVRLAPATWLTSGDVAGASLQRPHHAVPALGHQPAQ
ncbi:Uma2 family endonuclease [Actinoplanes sp. NPDC026619]|uniref:Uma2 family endonuclease n=1 Tax=Actinoplanes sp. NPDC026619 TaxID=3155798 RepID=UPI0033C7682D